MTYPSVPQQMSDPINENLKKLNDLFPGVVKDGQLDSEALRGELGDFVEIQPGDEKYELNWAGKQAAKKKAFEPLLGKTLKYVENESKHPETTGNLYIEGDNLEALKLLRQNYYGAVKMIYIDPPYNTGKDFVYKDNFRSSVEESDIAEGVRSGTGKRLIRNEDTNNRFHSIWLDMLYSRLKLAKELLTEDGVLFISIDDNENHNLRKITEEIFGGHNFLAELVWQLSSGPQAGHFTRSNESIIAYAKNKSQLPFFKDVGGETIKHGALKKISSANPAREVMFLKGSIRCESADIEFPDELGGSEKQYITNGKLRFKDGLLAEDVCIKAGWGMKNQLVDWLAGKETHDSKGQKVLRFYFNSQGILFYEKERGTTHPKTVIPSSEVGSTKTGGNEVKALFGEKIMSFPKPTGLIKFLTGLTSKKDELILDFFSGSATTADSVMQLNAEDGGTRKHIMVQLPEVCDEKSEAAKAGYKTIAEIGKERIRRAGDKIKAELTEKAKTATEEEKGANPYLANPDALDIGFKCFRIEDTKINWLKKDLSGGELVDSDISDKDKRDFVPGFTDLDVVYEIMLRQSSIPLTEPIQTLSEIGSRTYLYGESYLICLEEDITQPMVEKLAQLEPTPLKFIFRDSAFNKDIALKGNTFNRLNKEIAKHTDGEETYTVEFI